MDCTSPRGQEQTPEIEAGVSFEADPYSDLELDGIDPGDGCEGADHHGGGEIHPIVFWVI